ncbi:hypothetical protein [Bacillus pumilus]|uniref:hypothetical protein n=1 Tax=Bacillus pumilus TaxID=1408 RepID=UPI0016430A29|nr:hypothetical protein [Bacillus pumilus]
MLVRATPSELFTGEDEVAFAAGTYEESSNPKERATPVIVFFQFIMIIPLPKIVLLQLHYRKIDIVKKETKELYFT